VIGFDDCGGAGQRLLRESRNEAWTPVHLVVRQVSAGDWAVFRAAERHLCGGLETGVETKLLVSQALWPIPGA
jgi:hypothetical protein